jgi:RsiW-degrading membrane proteinase PrsW (M82 family)
MLLLILAIAPGLGICFYIVAKDQYNKEPRRFLVMSFILGVLSAFPASIIETIFGLNHLFEHSILAAALMAYPVVALAEEGSKYFMVRRYAFNKKEFDEPFDGIVYAIMVGMGFATIENIFYVMEFGLGVAILRALLSVPAHATFAVIMGYYMGEAKFAVTLEQRRRLLIKAVLYPVFWHGTFDFCLFLQENHLVRSAVSEWLLFLGAVASFIYAAILSRKAIREHVALSKEMHGPKSEDPGDSTNSSHGPEA